MTALANKIKDHFLNPRNVGRIENPTALGISGTPATGSGIKLYLQIGEGNVIQRVTYQIFNNAPSIAAASAFTELAVGKTLSQAGEIDRAAIMDYLGADDKSAGNLRFDVLSAYTDAIATLHGEKPASPDITPNAEAQAPKNPEGKAAGGKPKLMVMQLIQDVLDSEIRPAIAMDGGDVELVDVQDRRVLLRLHGHCVGCSSSNTTMRFFIEDRLRELVDPGLEVVDTTEFEGELHAPPGMFKS